MTVVIIVELSCCSIVEPSKAPDGFTVSAKSSTSITASWQLPPAEDRNGIIRGFRLFYKKKGSSGSSTQITINSGTTLRKVVTGLNKYTEYEFQVLAYTSVGDGPKSSKKYEKTNEDGKKLITHKWSLPCCVWYLMKWPITFYVYFEIFIPFNHCSTMYRLTCKNNNYPVL